MKIYPLYIFLTVIFLFGASVNALGAEIVTEEIVYYQDGKKDGDFFRKILINVDCTLMGKNF